MKKIKLIEFRKSYHASEKQELREMSDYEIEKVLNFGIPSYDSINERFVYKLGPQMVVTCLKSKTIVTVHPGDRPRSAPKLQLIHSASLEEVASSAPVVDEEEWDITDVYMSGDYFKKVG